MNFEAYDMKAELGFKQKINELLRRESSTPHIMETLTTSIGIIERSLCGSFISLAVNLNGLQTLLQRPFQGNSAMRLANLSKLYFGMVVAFNQREGITTGDIKKLKQFLKTILKKEENYGRSRRN